MINTDGNTHAINQHLFSLEEYGYAQDILDKMTDRQIMDYAEEWDIYIKDDSGKWVDEGFESLYEKIEENLDDFMGE